MGVGAWIQAFVTGHFKLASLNPRGNSEQQSSRDLLSKATPGELASRTSTEENQSQDREYVKGNLFHCKYFRALLRVVWGPSEPLENSGTVHQANANPSPAAACLSVCWADNADFFYLPSSSLLSVPRRIMSDL